MTVRTFVRRAQAASLAALLLTAIALLLEAR